MPLFDTTHRAQKLPDDGPRNGWWEILPPPPPARTLGGTIKADWAIVGAGACGIAVARRLAELKPADSVVLVDASRVGYGASGRNAGFMLNDHAHGGMEKHLEPGRRSNRLCGAGLDYLRELVGQHQIQCDWSEWGRVYVAQGTAGEAHLADLARAFDGLGVAYRTVDRRGMEAITGTGFYSRGLRADGSTLVQPAAMMRGLGATLPANVDLREETPITEVRREAGGHRVAGHRLIAPEGEIEAKTVILANGMFLEEFGYAKRRIVPIALFASLTRQLSPDEVRRVGEEGEFGLLPASPNGSTVRLTQDRRILMRNTLYYGREKTYSPEMMERVAANHREGIRRRWPDFEDIELAGTWGGMMGFTRNEGTVFGEISPGVHAVTTTDAAPMTKGTIAGKLLAEQLSGIDSELLQLLLSAPKAAWLPPDPILRFVVDWRIKRYEATDAAEL